MVLYKRRSKANNRVYRLLAFKLKNPYIFVVAMQSFFWNTSRQEQLKRRAFSTKAIYHFILKHPFDWKTIRGYPNKNYCEAKTYENSCLTKHLGGPHTYSCGKVTITLQNMLRQKTRFFIILIPMFLKANEFTGKCYDLV